MVAAICQRCLVIFATAGLWHCGSTDCGGQAVPANPNAPLITTMVLHEQVPGDPWRLALAIDFVDQDGDLGAGTLSLYENGSSTPSGPPSPLSTIFETSGGLPLTATSGRLSLTQGIVPTTTNAVLHLATQVTDGASHLSNCYSLDFQISLAGQ